MRRVKLLIAVINHGLNNKALALKAAFSPYASTIAIDSGSNLTEAQRQSFDICLPNVYYYGCLRAASEYAIQNHFTHVWIWASDVTCENPSEVVTLCVNTFTRTNTGVYAPSADYSFHRQMNPKPGFGLSQVSFTDGFCFAACSRLLSQVCADFEGNTFGFGMDIHAGLLARLRHQNVIVDHRYQVRHPQGAGYNVAKATQEWKHWCARQPFGTRLFHRLARKRLGKTPIGMRLLLTLPWQAWEIPTELEPAQKLVGGR